MPKAAGALRRAIYDGLVARFPHATRLMQLATACDPAFCDLPFIANDTVKSRLHALLFAEHFSVCKLNHVHERHGCDGVDRSAETKVCNAFPVLAHIAIPPSVPEPVAADAGGPRPPTAQSAFCSIFDMGKHAKKKGHDGYCYFDDELRRFLKHKEDGNPEEWRYPLTWWAANKGKFPGIARLARRFLAIPASEAPCERVFSHLNILLSPRRNRMLLDRATKLLFIKVNRKLVEYLRALKAKLVPAARAAGRGGTR